MDTYLATILKRLMSKSWNSGECESTRMSLARGSSTRSIRSAGSRQPISWPRRSTHKWEGGSNSG
jgi:hypothetical protein